MFQFQTSDYWLSKVLGCQSDKLYEATLKDENIYQIAFENKMYINTAKYLNVLCYDFSEPNFYI